MRMLVCVTMPLFILALAAGAQPPNGPPPGPGEPPMGPPPGPPAEPTPAVTDEAPPPPDGDIVTLKTGKKLTGMQVLRETPTSVEMLAMEGVPPLILPRTQVQSIQYDAIDPNKPGWNKQEEEAASKPEVIMGEEVSAEFHRKLTKPLSENEPVKFEDEGYVRLLRELSRRADVMLEVAEAAKELPVDQRQASFTVKPGTSLLTFLQDDFLKAFPQLAVKIQFDKIILTSKEAAANTAEAGAQ